MNKVLDKIMNCMRQISGMFLLSIVICVTIQIVCRSILHISTPWTEEIARYLLIWMTFLGSPVALQKGEHLMVDLFYSKYPARIRQYVHFGCEVSVAVFCSYLLYFGIKLCQDPRVQRFSSPAAGIPRTWVYSALPVGAFLMLIIALYDAYNTVLIVAGKRDDNTANAIIDENVSLDDIDRKRREEHI